MKPIKSEKITKTYSPESPVQFKQLDDGEYAGSVTARIATLEVVDKEGDIVKRGSVGTQDVIISAWAHGSTIGNMRPVGKGVVFEEGDGLYLEGQYNLDVPDALYDFKALVDGGTLLEWSFCYLIETGNFIERDDGTFGRDLDKLRVFEASPCLVGAGVATGTIATKALEEAKAEAKAEAQAKAKVEAHAQLKAQSVVAIVKAQSRQRGVSHGNCGA